jgi:hypothetical protein
MNSSRNSSSAKSSSAKSSSAKSSSAKSSSAKSSSANSSSANSSSANSSSAKSSSGKNILRTRKSKSKHRPNKTRKYEEIARQRRSFRFTEKEIDELKRKLRYIGFDDDSEIKSYVDELGSAAHVFSGDNFKQLLAQIDAFGNEHDGTITFKKWLKNEYSKIA